uniref:Uncharacterized protein n=1 Tax=Anguilla anguilla TaxID=7936 RepID=A0A0E9V163_ANGAN
MCCILDSEGHVSTKFQVINCPWQWGRSNCLLLSGEHATLLSQTPVMYR